MTRRAKRVNNPRFLEPKATIKGIPSLEKRKKLKQIQKESRRINR